MMKAEEKFALVALFLVLGAAIFLIGVLTNQTTPEKELNRPENSIPTGSIKGESTGVYLRTFGTITFNTPVPESPSSLPIYCGILNSENLVDMDLGPSIGNGTNIPSESGAPAIAMQVLSNYGGLPNDAILVGSSTSYAELVNMTTLQVDGRFAQDTMVSWKRLINGRPVKGDSDIIRVLLGDDGKPIWIYKEWRNYSFAGNASIIPATMAISKFEKGDIIDKYLDPGVNITIYNISLGYYARGLEEPNITLEPVWIFSGETSTGTGVTFSVYARKFANFTASPTSETIPLSVSFNDTSDDSPTKWFWNFGDETISTIQNPVHSFKANGSYNITLSACNEIGCDSETKNILVGNITP